MTAKRDLSQALLADLEQIQDNAALFRQGRNSACQAVVIQLRNLLLSGRRGLVARLMPQATFHQFRTSGAKLPPRGERPDPAKHSIVIFDARGRLTAESPAQLYLEFAEDLPLLPLSEWLQQWILRPDINLRQLINDMANEEVAHTQEDISPTLQRAHGFVAYGPSYERRVSEMAVVAIGEYVARRIRELLAS